MEEADKIITTTLKQLGININSLSEFDATSFIQAIILCFEKISKLLTEEDNFVDLKFLKKQNLKEATHRYKVCQKFVEYLKTLGYNYDLSFDAFLYPNVKDTRRLLGYLFEIIFQSEGNSKQSKNTAPTNEAAELVRRRMDRWQKKPWIMPDFLEGQKRNLLIAGEIIPCEKDIDFQRVAGSKSKKVKTLYTVMKNSLSVTKISEDFASGASLHGLALSQFGWLRGQQKLVITGGEDFLQEEDDNRGVKVEVGSILDSFRAALDHIIQPNGGTTAEISVPLSAAVQSAVAQDKTLKDILEERENDLKDLEQLATIQDTAYIEALADDITNESKPDATSTNPAVSTNSSKQQKKFNQSREDQYEFDVQSNDVSMVSATSQNSNSTQATNAVMDLNKQLEAKFNIEGLRAEKEAEIENFVAQLEAFKAEITASQTRADHYAQQKSGLEEEKTEMAATLKTVQKTVKKKKEVLKEVEKLAGQDLRVLQQEVGAINTELETLKEEWEEYKKPIKEEIFETKQQISDKRVEYQYKADKIKELKKELKQAVADIEHKKKVYQFMEAEWQAMPKDVNRNQYLKRINEIIGNLKSQNVEIRSILGEIGEIQKVTENTMRQIKTVDTEVEDLVFKDAQKDKVAKDIYKEIQSLKSDFDTLITSVQEKNKLRTQMKDVETKMDDFRIKYKNMTEINKLKQELAGVQQDNAQLQQRLGGK